MSRPASVTIVAVLSILGSLFTFLVAAGAVLLMQMPMPVEVQQTPLHRYTMLFTAGLFGALGLWGIGTAIGLFRMKRWARISTLVFSGGLVFYAACSLGFVFLLPAFIPGGEQPPFLRGIIVGMAVFYGLLSLIGIWWLVLFNRAAIKAQFYGGTVPVEPFPVPLSITAIALFLLTTCIFSPFMVFTDWPVIFLAWVVRGWAAKLLYLVYGIVGVAAGYGLLKRKMWAYWLTVGYVGFGLVNTLAFYAVPGSQERLVELMRGMILPGTETAVPRISALEGILSGLLVGGLLLYFLLTRKRRYEDACRAAAIHHSAPPQT